MNKHTPGPWVEIPQFDAGPMIARRYDTGKQMNPTGLRLVCHMLERGGSLDEDKANARLISAAPDLYEALKEILEHVEMWMGQHPDAVDKAQHAIAKAEGRT